MDEIEIDISYDGLIAILKQTQGVLYKYKPHQIRVVKVVDKPSIIPDNDRITIHIDIV
jgi:hypothetical protein